MLLGSSLANEGDGVMQVVSSVEFQVQVQVATTNKLWGKWAAMTCLVPRMF